MEQILHECSDNSGYNHKQMMTARMRPETPPHIETDMLARSTQDLKQIISLWKSLSGRIAHSKWFMILTRTTQPAHVIAILSVMLVAMMLVPRRDTSSSTGHSSFYTFLYLFTFAIHFGSQMWMTFVSGLSLYFSIPRHHFSEVQKVLFPRYFAINSFLGLLSLASYVKLTSNHIHTLQFTQIVILVVSFLVELLVSLYLAPPLIRLIDRKNKLEREEGCDGLEIGRFVITESLNNNQVYIKTHKKFRKVHISIAIFNMISICCSIAQIYLLNNFISFDIHVVL